MVNKSEQIVKNEFEARGYKSLRGGYPDFIFYKEKEDKIKEVIFVEVKSKFDSLRKEQEICAKILKSLGLNYRLIGGRKGIKRTINTRQYVIKKRIVNMFNNIKIYTTKHFFKSSIKIRCPNKKCIESNKDNNGKPYEWEYKGNNPFYASCPRCKTSIKLKEKSNE